MKHLVYQKMPPQKKLRRHIERFVWGSKFEENTRLIKIKEKKIFGFSLIQYCILLKIVYVLKIFFSNN